MHWIGAYICAIAICVVLENFFPTLGGLTLIVMITPIAVLAAMGIALHFYIFLRRVFLSLTGATWCDFDGAEYKGVTGFFTAVAYFVAFSAGHIFFGGVIITFAIAGTFVIHYFTTERTFSTPFSK